MTTNELTITTTPELGAIARHPLTRLCFPTIAHQWKFAEYYTLMQQKSETLLSLRDVIEQWRTMPFDQLIKLYYYEGNTYSSRSDSAATKEGST